MQITDFVVPLLFAGVMIFGAVRRVDVFPVFCEGAAGGLKTTVDILPALVLLRPFSGSGAIAVYDSIAAQYGADSFPGRVAAVLLGSSETTFYTVAVYFSAVRVKNTRYAIPAALAADCTAWIVCGLTVSALLG